MDRRQRKTRRAIYDAFEALMATEHYNSVTVAQIIEKADIGRSTFYAHFETKDDLLAAMCREMFDHIFEGVNEQCETHPDLVTETLEGKLAHLLYHLRDSHSGVCGKLICDGEPHFTSYFKQQLRILFEKDGPSERGDMPKDLLLELEVSSFVSAVIWWFGTGSATEQGGRAKKKQVPSPEQVAAWCCIQRS